MAAAVDLVAVVAAADLEDAEAEVAVDLEDVEVEVVEVPVWVEVEVTETALATKKFWKEVPPSLETSIDRLKSSALSLLPYF